MSNTAVIEREPEEITDNSGTINSSRDIVLNTRIEALRDLMRALSEQIEALGEARKTDAAKRNISLYDEVRRFETEIIRYALMRTGGHQRRAARLLDIKVTTLNAKIKRYNIKVEEIVNHMVDTRLPKQTDSSEGAYKNQ